MLNVMVGVTSNLFPRRFPSDMIDECTDWTSIAIRLSISGIVQN